MRVWAVKGTKVAPSFSISRSRMLILLLGQDDDAASFRSFVRQRRELGRVGQRGLGDAVGGNEVHRLAVAQGDRAGLVQEQHVDVAGRLDGPAGHGDDVGFWIIRSMPAMPMAESSAPMVVGIRQTSSATRTVTVTGVPWPAAPTL